jgi:hypothetical protein
MKAADAVYFGFQNTTNARQFAGLNFTDKRAREGIDYAARRHHGPRLDGRSRRALRAPPPWVPASAAGNSAIRNRSHHADV